MFDYFVARMTCTNCGTTSAADSSTDMQTHLRHDARSIEIAVGFELDPLEGRDRDIRSSGYLATGRPRRADNRELDVPDMQAPELGADHDRGQARRGDRGDHARPQGA